MSQYSFSTYSIIAMTTETSTTQYSRFIGVYYAIPAIGGFKLEQHFGTIPMVTEMDVEELDLTLALQINVNVRTFNEKIGLFKDASNNNILQSSFDVSSGSFPIQDISFNYQDLLPDIITDNIISVGGFSTIYRDFKRTIINYYEHADEVSLFDVSGTLTLEEPGFTNEDFVDIFTSPNQMGGYDVSGNINIYRISTILQSLYNEDPFNNRSNKTYQEGFIAGDIISLSSGMSIRLDLLSQTPAQLTSLDYTTENETPPILLSKIYTAPLVLHLENL